MLHSKFSKKICIENRVNIQPLRNDSTLELGRICTWLLHQSIALCSYSNEITGSPTRPIVTADESVKPTRRSSFSEMERGSTKESNPPINNNAASQLRWMFDRVEILYCQPIFSEINLVGDDLPWFSHGFDSIGVCSISSFRLLSLVAVLNSLLSWVAIRKPLPALLSWLTWLIRTSIDLSSNQESGSSKIISLGSLQTMAGISPAITETLRCWPPERYAILSCFLWDKPYISKIGKKSKLDWEILQTGLCIWYKKSWRSRCTWGWFSWSRQHLRI